MSKMSPRDTVWYWDGGTEIGVWRPASPLPNPLGDGQTLAELRDDIARGGRVAVLGTRAIGPPEGPPSRAALTQVGFL